MKSNTLKCVSLLLALLLCIGASGVLSPVSAAEGTTGFSYEHDPRENPYAMQEIVEDETAVYGFRPSETGSLKLYASADWSDPAVVESGRQTRIVYHESLAAMYDLLQEMQAAGESTEAIARAISAKRNQIRMDSYADDPEGLAALKERNLEKYGHEEGPLPDDLYAQYGSWDRVIEKAFSANVGMDVCLGLYDDYYFLYVALGQVPCDHLDENADGKCDRCGAPTACAATILVAGAQKVRRGTNVDIRARAEHLDPAFHLVLCVNGEEIEGSCREVRCLCAGLKTDLDYSVRIVDAAGKVQKDANGDDLVRDGGTITCDQRFLARLLNCLYFILFRAFPTVTVAP